MAEIKYTPFMDILADFVYNPKNEGISNQEAVKRLNALVRKHVDMVLVPKLSKPTVH